MATSATLLPYYGEFLYSPFPVELSMGKCSHGCRYCFSRANGYEGWSGYDSFVKTLKKILDGTKNNLCAQLIRQKFPILISNRSDPFAQSNSRDALMVLKLLTKNEIPVAIQTKGGPGAIQAAQMIPPSDWYTSISFSGDASKIEPGAPSISERLDMIEQVAKLGHYVEVGVNPVVPEWFPEAHKMLQRFKDIGVHTITCEFLHFNAQQLGNLSRADLEAIGKPIIDRSSRRFVDQGDWDFREEIKSVCGEIGLDYIEGGSSNPAKYSDFIDEKYRNRFGINQDFVNVCHEQIPDNTVLSFDDYWEMLGPTFPDGLYQLDSAIYSVARNLWKEVHPPRYMTFRDLLKIIWSSPKHVMCIANLQCFSFASEGLDGNGKKIQLIDENGIPLVVFSRKGFQDYYVDTKE